MIHAGFGSRWSGVNAALGCAVSALFCATTGCGALGAAANPKVAPYLNEHTPLVIVVDRADAAETTAKEVDRLLTSTPVDAQWPKQLELANDKVHGYQAHPGRQMQLTKVWMS